MFGSILGRPGLGVTFVSLRNLCGLTKEAPRRNMKKIQMNYATPAIETTPVTEANTRFDRICAYQANALRKLFACLDVDITPFEERPMSDPIPLMFGHVSLIAERYGCQTEPSPSLSPLPTASELRLMLEAFGRLNAQIWPHEQTFENETEENKPWRALGEAMHWLYEVIKYENMLAGGEHWPDPAFSSVFQEGIKRAQAGEPIAVAVMRDKWGMMF